MNTFELHVQKLFQDNGWESLRAGWPDFLMYRVSDDQKIELMAIEAKSGNDKLRPGQEKMLALLSTAMPVKVVLEGPGYGRFLGQWESHSLPYTLSRYENENGLWLTPQIDEHRIKQCSCIWEWWRNCCTEHRMVEAQKSA